MAVLLGQVVVTTQPTEPSPAFTQASVTRFDPANRNHPGRQLTVSTFVDRASLLEFIVAAYLDADGAGACAEKIFLGSECAPIVGSVPDWMRTEKFEIRATLPPDSVPSRGGKRREVPIQQLASSERLSAARSVDAPETTGGDIRPQGPA
jgi:hypothetical protein